MFNSGRVKSNIAALESQREREAKLAAVSQAAQTSLTLSIAQRSSLNADFERSAAHTRVLVERVALYKALAGGWPQ